MNPAAPFASVLLFASICAAQAPTQGDYTIPNFHFASGQTLPELRLHYRTVGEPKKDAAGHTTNAVLILHGTTGSGGGFFRPEFSGELFGPGQPLDAARFFLILPDDIGHGSSSKPSDGLHAKFPNYCYADMIEGEYRLVTDGLRVDHLRLVMGTSMGGMHTWLWGSTHPDSMDALLPLASLPAEISGRNRVWRKMIADSIRHDCDWNNGEYTSQPRGLRTAASVLYFMSNNPRQRSLEAPTSAAADKALDAYCDNAMKTMDANDVLYAVESSRDYNPDVAAIKAPLLAINFADDLINPPDLGILESRIKKVAHGVAVTMPESPASRGHGTHTLAAIWKPQLIEFLKATER
jgi:homoserine O-acetyltransferase